MCDFSAEYNFQEIKYEPGPDNVLPDFLSQPWDGDKTLLPFHMFVRTAPPRQSRQHSLQYIKHQSVVVLPSLRGHVALQHCDWAVGLWAVDVTPSETSVHAMRHAILPILPAHYKQPAQDRIGWRAMVT